MGRWIFEQLRGGPRRTPQEAELFKDKDADEGEYPGNDYLVREVLQNALDARVEDAGEPVRVRFAIHDVADAPGRGRLAHYFARLRAPLAPFGIKFDSDLVPELAPRFLVCEDFGTRGLEGNPLLFRDPSDGHNGREDFYWFWRNIGRSAKTGVDLGRWGLGKTVYRAVSRVRCMLGLTVRRSDKSALLMGQGVLQPHSDNGQEYHPEGYWCSDEDPEFPNPITEGDEIEQFRREWRLTRNGEPGLSVVSPFVPEELRDDRILQAVIVNFFVRILRGELAVEVAGPQLGTITLDASSIEDVAKSRLTWNGPKRTKRHEPPPFEFVRRCFSLPALADSRVLGEKKIPDATEAFEEPELNSLRNRFSKGELLGIRLKLWLPLLGGGGQEGKAEVYLQREGTPSRHDSYYVREGMTITKITSRAGLHGVQALVIVDQGPLAELLGDTEGPAHEDWQTSNDQPGRKWHKWSGRVRFMRRIVDNLVELLTPPATQPDFDLLADFFSVPRSKGQQHGAQEGEGEKPPAAMPPITQNPKWYQVTEQANGFTVSRNPHVPMPSDAALRVAVAYDIPQGDPIRKWSELDFKITREGGIPPKGDGVRIRSVKGNIVRLAIEGQQFWFKLNGFDPHRDLFVRVDEETGQEEGEESQA